MRERKGGRGEREGREKREEEEVHTSLSITLLTKSLGNGDALQEANERSDSNSDANFLQLHNISST